MRYSIADRYAKARSERDQLEGDRFHSNKYKRLREWFVLGAAIEQLRSISAEFPEFAVENLKPDFLTFRSDGIPWHPIEITQALRPGDKPHKRFIESKTDESLFRNLPPPLENPWDSLQTQISKKAHAGYSRDTCLIVYLSVWIFDFHDWRTSVAERLRHQHFISPFRDVDQFSRVLVLTSGMDALVELHKEARQD